MSATFCDPDCLLDELELAEKRHAEFEISMVKDMRRHLDQVVALASVPENGSFNDTGRMERLNKIQEHNDEITKLQKKKAQLWLKWVLLKPYNTDEQKEVFMINYKDTWGELPKEEKKPTKEEEEAELERTIREIENKKRIIDSQMERATEKLKKLREEK